uniref:Peptidase C1A papain C-terminal domain-containing protein n=1 Tax=Ditylenchus dipsaci TaxID=166011 RepID=A0A915D0S5_9BILA
MKKSIVNLNRPFSVSVEPLLIPDARNETRRKRKAANRDFCHALLLILVALLACAFIYNYFPRILRRYHNYKDQIENTDWSKVASRLKHDFEMFEKKFERKWHESQEERAKRFEAFEKSFYQVQHLNSNSHISNSSHEINDFSDWTEDEIKRVVTPVKAQGKCGSCWAFATAATVESAYAVAHKELRSLSEQELLDCNLNNNACNGGNVARAFRFVHEHGLMLESEYPYVAHRQNSCALAGETTKIDTAYFLDRTEADMIDWLVNFGPVNIGISVTQPMMSYKSGVFRLQTMTASTRRRREVLDSKKQLGQNWGTERGYVYFARGVNACGIEDEPIGLLA